MRRRHYVKGKAFRVKILLMVLDLLLYHVGIISAFWIRFLGAPPAFNFWSYRDLIETGMLRFTPSFGIPIPGYLWLMPPSVFFFLGMYSLRWSRAKAEDFMIVFRAMLVTTILLLAGVYVYREQTASFPISVLFLSFFTGCALTSSWRIAARKLYFPKAGKDRPRKLLVVGGTSDDRATVERFLQDEAAHYEAVGCLTPSWPNPSAEMPLDAPHAGTLPRFEESLAKLAVDEVLVVPSNLTPVESLEVIRVCESRNLTYRYLPKLLDVFVSGARVGLVNFVPTLQFGNAYINGWNAPFKRAFDVVMAAVGLVVSVPLLLAVSVWIMLDSPGLPLFAQERVGRYRRRFKIYKFRTMLQGAENHSPLTLHNDSRITNAGKVLRRWSIDELPQLINVLKGDMSLVGPRAVVPFVAEKFNELERMTLNVSPGLTGLAQVSGRDELGFKEKSVLNLYYIRNYSLLLDIQILLRTIAAVYRRTGTNGTRLT